MAPKPDLIVAIDFGMCYTGVAFAVSHSSVGFSEPRVFIDWPGLPHGLTGAKAPTILSYAPTAWNEQPLAAWGFEAASSVTMAYFKTLLQPDQNQPAISTQEQRVDRAITDYLGCLHSCIQTYFTPTQLGTTWQKAIIEFRFSVPAGWEANTVNRFVRHAASAGFQTSDGNHTIGTILTESAAAAIFAIKEGLAGIRAGSTILAVDVGGGTADISLVSVRAIEDHTFQVAEEQCSSNYVGASYIDRRFQEMVRRRLQASVHQHLVEDTDRIAWLAMRSRAFQNGKKRLHQMIDLRSTMRIRIPSLSTEETYLDLGIVEGTLIIHGHDLAPLFDSEIERLQQMIDGYLLQHAAHEIDAILLSGGLCSSQYVQRQLRAAYSDEIWGGIATVPSIHVSTDPAMCVARGQVIDAVQRWERELPAADMLVVHLGYGVLLGNKLSKLGATGASKDQERDDEDEDCKRSRRHIRWLIKPEVPIPTLRWQTVDVDQYIFNPNGAELAPELVGDLEVVCNIPRYNPKYLSPVWNHKDVRVVRKFRCNFRQCVVDEWRSVSDHIWTSRRQIKVAFRVCARVGPRGDMEFQCQTRDGLDIEI